MIRAGELSAKGVGGQLSRVRSARSKARRLAEPFPTLMLYDYEEK